MTEDDMAGITEADEKILFGDARTYSVWEDREVPEETIRKIYDLAKTAPTAANCQPMRVVFLRSAEAKKKLEPCLDAGNVKKTMSAPVTAIVAGDTRFYEHFDKLYPIADVKSWYEGKPDMIEDAVLRNTALQGAYLIMAARSLGLDCGPMSGFNKEMTDEIFFKGTPYKSNFLCNIGYGVRPYPHPRLPRFDFDEACQIL